MSVSVSVFTLARCRRAERRFFSSRFSRASVVSIWQPLPGGTVPGSGGGATPWLRGDTCDARTGAARAAGVALRGKQPSEPDESAFTTRCRLLRPSTRVGTLGAREAMAPRRMHRLPGSCPLRGLSFPECCFRALDGMYWCAVQERSGQVPRAAAILDCFSESGHWYLPVDTL